MWKKAADKHRKTKTKKKNECKPINQLNWNSWLFKACSLLGNYA